MRERKRVQRKFKGKTLTQQNFRKECDINLIYSRFQQTGQLPEGRVRQVQYGESVGDFQEAAFAMARARSTFELLPNGIREKYGSLENVMGLMQDPVNAPELHADGIFTAFGAKVTENKEPPPQEQGELNITPADNSALGEQPKAEGGEAPSEAS